MDPHRIRLPWVRPRAGSRLVDEVNHSRLALANATLDDASPDVTYSGFSSISSSSPTPEAGSSSGSTVSIDPSDHDGTLSGTGTPGSTASVSFYGSSILVYGLTAPSLGAFTAELDGGDAANLATHATILFFATDLDPTKAHQLILTCQGGGLVLDEWVVYGPAGQVGFT